MDANNLGPDYDIQTLTDYEDFFEELNDLETDIDVSDTISCSCGLPSVRNLLECAGVSCKRLFHSDCLTLNVNDGASARPHVADGIGSLTSEDAGLCFECRSQGTISTVLEANTGTAETTDKTPELTIEQPDQDPPTTSKSKKKKKVGMVYPEKRFTLADSPIGYFFKTALMAVDTESSMQIKSSCSRKVKELVDSILTISASEELHAFATYADEEVWATIEPMQGVSWNETKKVEMWQRFHTLRCSQELLFKWDGLLNHFGLAREQPSQIMLLQIIIRRQHKDIMAQLVEKDRNVCESDQRLSGQFEEHEAQALRYCAGYIPFKLIKKYKRMKNRQSAEQYIHVLRSWSEQQDAEDTGFLNYTKEWLKMNDRGGLFKINDETYRFFQTLEIVVQSKISTKHLASYSQLNMKEFLLNEFRASKFVDVTWGKICRGLCPEMSCKLLEEVLLCFIKMRINAFLKVVMMMKKASSSSVSKKGEKALRKTLNPSEK